MLKKSALSINKEAVARVKLRYLIFLLTLITIIFSPIPSLSGQDFAPPGSQWKFDRTFAFSGTVTYYTYTTKGDTTVLNKNCRIINIDLPSCSHYVYGDQMIHESNDTLYHFDAEENKFDRIVVFNAAVGDSWIVEKTDGISDDSMRCQVDSISFFIFGFDSLRVQHVSLTPFNNGQLLPYSQPAQIIEKVGFKNGILPDRFQDICDGSFVGDIRCYEDNEVGLINFTNNDCNYISSNTQNEALARFDVFPNPFCDYIKFDFKNNDIRLKSIKLLGFNGELIYSSSHASLINTSDISSGIYILLIETENVKSIWKLIKH